MARRDINEGLLILRYTKECSVRQKVIDDIKEKCKKTGIQFAETKFEGFY